MLEYVEDSKCKNRHIEFVRSIFVNVSETLELEEKDDLTTTLDKLLAHIFDGEG